MNTLVIRFAPDDTPTNYGYYHCQECKASFFGGGDALHARGCSRTGYGGLEYFLNPKAAAIVLSGKSNLNPVTAEQLRAAIPDIEEQIRAAVRAPKDGGA